MIPKPVFTTKHFQASGADYTYDFENRLTRVGLTGMLHPHGANTHYVNYKYDALGRRIEREGIDGAIERYVYDGQDVIEDLDDSGDVVTSYLNGPGIDDKIRQTDATNGSLYFVTDHLGSTRALTDSNGDVVETIEFDSFGNSSGSSYTRYTYTGREFDSDTLLYYYRARWYDPEVGRFISEDPIELSDGINLYAYVSNKPVLLTDPAGTQMRSDRNWNEGEKNPLTGETLHNGFSQAAGMGCALDGFNPWISADVSGGFQVINFLGGNGGVGVMVNPFTLEVCFFTRVAASPGVATGLYAGGGGQFGFSFGPAEGRSAGGPGGELFVDATEGAGISGRAIGFGKNGFSGGISVGPTFGSGFSFGGRFTYTKILYCINSPKCPCSH